MTITIPLIQRVMFQLKQREAKFTEIRQRGCEKDALSSWVYHFGSREQSFTLLAVKHDEFLQIEILPTSFEKAKHGCLVSFVWRPREFTNREGVIDVTYRRVLLCARVRNTRNATFDLFKVFWKIRDAINSYTR